MQIKIQLFAFVAAVVVFVARVLISKADKEGNIHIMSPKKILFEIKSGYKIFTEHFVKSRKKERFFHGRK